MTSFQSSKIEYSSCFQHVCSNKIYILCILDVATYAMQNCSSNYALYKYVLKVLLPTRAHSLTDIHMNNVIQHKNQINRLHKKLGLKSNPIESRLSFQIWKA